MSTPDNVRQMPTNAEVGQAWAYVQAIASGFGIVDIEAWIGQGDGTASYTDEEGTTLLYTGDEMHKFDAILPCNVHRRHRYGVSTPEQLDEVRAITAECSATAQEPRPAPATDTPTVALRTVEDPATVDPEPPATPAPLWLITRAADTPGHDRQPTTVS
ncbi:hypothetical protein ABZ619_39170 [Streptomyces sp. NPDC007851]|uniref:hypothetical protein n=1 Tax=Streptomyces sp. NPDC007851 TaxID=3155008 RepID=UPI0033EB8524